MKEHAVVHATNGHIEIDLTAEQVQRLGLGGGAAPRVEVEESAITLVPIRTPSEEELIEDARDFMRRYRSTFERLAQ